MISRKRFTLVAATAAALLVLAGCSDPGTSSSPSDSAGGTPVAGGSLRVIEMAQPNGFDPTQAFSPSVTTFTWTGLYGQFLVPDTATGGYKCGMCESFTTPDQGATWIVKTRPGMTFTDGTPYDAAAVKYNWDRIKDPANGSASQGVASQIDHIEVTDATTAKLVMTQPAPGFRDIFPTWALQFIASPTALAQGKETFNKNPIGAGPFVFGSWVPNGELVLKKNPKYYDQPKPYLDELHIQGVADNAQRLNALISGSADYIMNSDASTFDQGKAAGFVEDLYTFNGGIGFMLNTSKPPFNDVKARNALAAALDMKALSDAVTKGFASAPATLFTKDSIFYEDVPLTTYDPKKAQQLFDEIAAAGTPLTFKYTVFPGNGPTVFDALAAQLKSYKNVTVVADQRDSTQQGVVTTSGDFEVASSSLAFAEPCSQLISKLFGVGNKGNWSRINDPQLNDALTAACNAKDVATQKAQYKIVQERIAALDPYILYQAYLYGALTTDKVHGVDIFGYTSPGAADVWMQP